MNNREQIELIERQIKAKGFCSDDDSKSISLLKRQQLANPLSEITSELSKPFIKILNWVSKVLFKSK